MHPLIIDLTGERFGRLIVLALGPKTAYGMWTWLCRCDCGKEIYRVGKCLRNGTAKSCGCFMKEQTSAANKTHGMTKDTQEYKIWVSMKRRCLNIKDPSYFDYGGRGITLCERWNSFENFYADMGARPSKDHSIDRIDVNGNYCPENCRWATRIEQCNNRRSNKLLTHNGMTMTVANWARHLGVKEHALHNRLRARWPLEKVLVGYVYPQKKLPLTIQQS